MTILTVRLTSVEGEMDAHLDEEERNLGNRRNGKMHKQVQMPLGEVTLSTPRDHNASFAPVYQEAGNDLSRECAQAYHWVYTL